MMLNIATLSSKNVVQLVFRPTGLNQRMSLAEGCDAVCKSDWGIVPTDIIRQIHKRRAPHETHWMWCASIKHTKAALDRFASGWKMLKRRNKHYYGAGASLINLKLFIFTKMQDQTKRGQVTSVIDSKCHN